MHLGFLLFHNYDALGLIYKVGQKRRLKLNYAELSTTDKSQAQLKLLMLVFPEAEIAATDII